MLAIVYCIAFFSISTLFLASKCIAATIKLIEFLKQWETRPCVWIIKFSRRAFRTRVLVSWHGGTRCRAVDDGEMKQQHHTCIISLTRFGICVKSSSPIIFTEPFHFDLLAIAFKDARSFLTPRRSSASHDRSLLAVVQELWKRDGIRLATNVEWLLHFHWICYSLRHS